MYLTGIKSERLLFRPLTLDDIEFWSRYVADERSREYLLPTDLSASEFASFWINKQLNRYKNQQGGLYAVLLKETEEFIGQCGLLTQEVDSKIEMEIGYHFFPKHWGKGYATEAAIHFKNWGFENNFSKSIISIIQINNEASKNVARKNGMTVDKRTVWKGIEVDIFRING